MDRNSNRNEDEYDKIRLRAIYFVLRMVRNVNNAVSPDFVASENIYPSSPATGKNNLRFIHPGLSFSRTAVPNIFSCAENQFY